MLSSLRIDSLAIIDHLEINLVEGLNVLTGETGAGKSIIVGALDLILGGRATADVVRQGAEEATVEGLFRLRGEAPREALRALDLADDDPSVMLVRRVVSRAGRNRIYINGNLATASMLRDVTRSLVDLSSQHAQYALLDPANHLDILDRFGGLIEQRDAYTAVFAGMRALEAERDALRKAERQRLEREDFLRFQLGELNEAALRPGEDAELDAERKRLANAEKLREGAGSVVGALDGGRSSAISLICAAEASLKGLGGLDGALAPLQGRLESARIEIEDLVFEMRRYASSIDGDPNRLAFVEERSDLIRRMKRKYGATVDDILARQAEIVEELDRFASAEERLEQLEKQLSSKRAELLGLGRALSTARAEASGHLSRLVEQELESLAMGRSRLRLALDTAGGDGQPAFTATGLDRVELMVATNVGEPYKPIARCASGGELSRILLALKGVLLVSDPVYTSIFDEVDAGVGGAVAEILGRKLKLASRDRQVLCITHLPQVAAFADQHLRVEKREQEGRTVTHVAGLSSEARELEVARMLGGLTITERTREHAREMIRNAATFA